MDVGLRRVGGRRSEGQSRASDIGERIKIQSRQQVVAGRQNHLDADVIQVPLEGRRRSPRCDIHRRLELLSSVFLRYILTTI